MAGPAELRDARGCDHMLIGGAMSRQAGEPRPSWGRTPSAIDGRGGRGLQLKADGSRAVEGTNKASAHVVLVDSFRGGVFQERKEGWRRLAKSDLPGPDREWVEGLEVGTNPERADQEFMNSLRVPCLPGGPVHWRRPRDGAVRSSQIAMSTSAPAGLFPGLQPQHDPSVRQELRNRLRIKHGSVLAGWRALDPLGHGKLSFNDFCRGVRTLGGIHDVRGLWEALGKESSGFVGVQDIDPELAWLLQDFKRCLIEKCGSAEAAWQQHFCQTAGHGTESKGRCAPRTFAQAAQELGYTGSARAVFKALDVDRVPGGISHKEFTLLDKWFHLKTAQPAAGIGRTAPSSGDSSPSGAPSRPVGSGLNLHARRHAKGTFAGTW